MSDIVERIRKAKFFCAVGAPLKDDIIQCEQIIGVAFAEDYKEYVSTFGAASFEGRELTGVCGSNRLSVVSATERARKYYKAFPPHVYVIEELNFDHVVIAQNSKGTVYCYGPSEKATIIAKNLKDYLFSQNN